MSLVPFAALLAGALVPMALASPPSGHGGVTVDCQQTKPTSVNGCMPELTVTDTSLATGVWTATKIPRGAGLGQGTVVGIFIYSHGVGIGPSPIKVQVPFGHLCVGLHTYKDFERSAPACPPALVPGALPGVCNAGPMQTALACGQGALGIAAGEDVNVQLWYRDAAAAGGSGLSHAIAYTLQ